MGYSEIISKLISDFEQSKKQIDDEWNAKIKEKKDQIDRQIKDLYENKIKEIEKQIEESHHSRFLNAKLYQKNLVLKKKRELINSVFEKAYKKICQMDDEKYISVLMDLIEKYSNKKDEIIYLSNADYSRYKNILEKKLKEKNITFKSIESSTKFEKGLILYDEKNKIETNLSFESIYQRKKEKLENHIGKILHVI